jgi:hypothetical protein
MPSQNSHETACRGGRAARRRQEEDHHPSGVGRSTASATTSVIEWKSGERRISVRTARDRVVEEFCFRLGQAFPAAKLVV